MTQKGPNNFARGGQRRFRRGATLVEMMVSIAITIGMLAAAGIVYKSAGDASGQAMANSVIMERYRSLTSQLERDFTGLRPDMPLAIIFENQFFIDPVTGKQKPCRFDRIVFFAAGDFQVGDYGTTNTVSANLARIFYGQSIDGWITGRLRTPAHSTAPLRQILARRCNLITPNAGTWPFPLPLKPEAYDCTPIDNAISTAEWKNATYINFQTAYFNDDLTDTINYPPSIIRRPDILVVKNILGYNGNNAMQRLYLLPDLTDFKIQLWFDDAPPEFNQRWIPDYWDMQTFPPFAANKFGFCWNILNSPNIKDPIIKGNYFMWSDRALENPAALNLTSGKAWQSTWPKAIKFTFTLYDKTRHHYPQGRTFSYIINLPPRY